MNKIIANGILKKAEKPYDSRYLYWLEVARKSGTIDTVMVLSEDGGLMEGLVKITGALKSEYIHPVGVPVFIVPEMVEPGEEKAEVSSEAVVTGTLKHNPVCRTTKKGKNVSTILLITEGGTIPVLLWNDNAKQAPDKFKEGDTLTATGRLQSREYPVKDGARTTYELSARKIILAEGEDA